MARSRRSSLRPNHRELESFPGSDPTGAPGAETHRRYERQHFAVMLLAGFPQGAIAAKHLVAAWPRVIVEESVGFAQSKGHGTSEAYDRTARNCRNVANLLLKASG